MMAMFVMTPATNASAGRQTGISSAYAEASADSHALRPMDGEKAAATGLEGLEKPVTPAPAADERKAADMAGAAGENKEIAAILGLGDIAPEKEITSGDFRGKFYFGAVLWLPNKREAVAIYVKFNDNGIEAFATLNKDGNIEGTFAYSGADLQHYFYNSLEYQRVNNVDQSYNIIRKLTPMKYVGVVGVGEIETPTVRKWLDDMNIQADRISVFDTRELALAVLQNEDYIIVEKVGNDFNFVTAAGEIKIVVDISKPFEEFKPEFDKALARSI